MGQIPTSYTLTLALDGLRGARIGVIRQPMDARTNVTSDDYKKVRDVIDLAIGDLKALGAEVVDSVTIPAWSIG